MYCIVAVRISCFIVCIDYSLLGIIQWLNWIQVVSISFTVLGLSIEAFNAQDHFVYSPNDH